MSEPLRHISEAAATTVTASKIGTAGATATTIGASYFGQTDIALAGLAATVFFGVMGVLVNWYFRHKEDKRRDEEHRATMAKLTK